MMSLSFLPLLAFQGVSYQAENVGFMVLCLLLITGAWHLLRHPFWGPRLRTLRSNKMAFLSFIVFSGFVGIAILDGLAWKDQVDDAADIALQAREPRSVLDRVYSAAVGVPEYAFKEKTYSAPFAKVEFVDETRELQYRHALGTTQTGFDTLYQVLKGVKPSVVIGVLPLLIAVPLALLFGITAGFFGGKVDDFIVYIYSTLASIPGLLLLIALITALGQGLLQIAVGLGVTGWIGLCRLVRGETFKLREMEYVQAARCLGTPTYKTILKHIVPNLMHIIIITSILSFSGLVMSESILAYLGIGLEHSWGGMINNARDELSRDPVIWWNLVYASTALFLLVLSVNVLGDALRDILDPKAAAGDGE